MFFSDLNDCVVQRQYRGERWTFRWAIWHWFTGELRVWGRESTLPLLPISQPMDYYLPSCLGRRRRERETHRQIDMRESKNNRGGRCSKCIRKLEKERPPYSERDLKIIGSTVGKHGDTEDLSTALDLGNIWNCKKQGLLVQLIMNNPSVSPSMLCCGVFHLH